MPRAVIDVGTNTVRLLIGRIENQKVVRLAFRRIITRLGSKINETSELSEDSIGITISYMAAFKVVCDDYNVCHLMAIGTSALREASNGAAFVNMVLEATGIPIKIVSGEEEAELTLRGILSGMQSDEKIASCPSLLVDIGGGSTEWILSDVTNTFGSISMGVLKLFENFIRHDPPQSNELQTMKDYVMIRLCGLASAADSYSTLNLIVTGGSATTLASIDMSLDHYSGDLIHLHKIKLSRVKAIYDKLISLPLDARRKTMGLESERADVIIPGILILIAIMEMLHLEEMTVSDYGLLEGALLTPALWLPGMLK
ncbi:MAG: hypothetical protein ACLPX5_17010 [Dissulfurispiraceae bacterium]